MRGQTVMDSRSRYLFDYLAPSNWAGLGMPNMPLELVSIQTSRMQYLPGPQSFEESSLFIVQPT